MWVSCLQGSFVRSCRDFNLTSGDAHPLSTRFTRTAPMLQPGLRGRNMGGGVSGNTRPGPRRGTSLPPGPASQSPSVSTAQSSTSSGKLPSCEEELRKVCLVVSGEPGLSDPGPEEIPCGRMNCQAGIRFRVRDEEREHRLGRFGSASGSRRVTGVPW